jgi:hypothetical protein
MAAAGTSELVGGYFEPMKLFISVSTHSLSGSRFIVNYAQSCFYSVFKFALEDLPLPLSELYCSASDSTMITRLENAMLEGRSVDARINLQDKHKLVLLCNVSITAGAGVCTGVAGNQIEMCGRCTVLTVHDAVLVGDRSEDCWTTMDNLN